MKRHLFAKICAIIAVGAAFVIGCTTVDPDDVDVNELQGYVLGATYPDPSITNKYDGLTVYMKKKGKIYNKERIIQCNTAEINGFTIVEDDPEYVAGTKGVLSNAWTYATVTNSGTYVKVAGNYEDEECWKSKDDDAFLGFVTDVSALSPTEFRSITNSDTSVAIYRTTKFDDGLTNKYQRINTVLSSAITDRETAISAFNELLSGLKSQ